MVNRRASDADPPSTPIVPVVKRKRRASCLGEQERRERKRAIDREAQRSLREKTKTHIAELERTIQILRDQDRNGATASLLSEIDGLRAENERLRDVIDSVKSVVGGEIFPRGGQNPASAVPDASPGATGVGHQSPKPKPNSTSNTETQGDRKPQLHPLEPLMPDPMHNQFESINFGDAPTTRGRLDLDGMTVMTDLASEHSNLGLHLDLDPVQEISEEGNILDVPDSPTTAAFAPFMSEIFGPSWRCPSPVILHIGNPARPATPSTQNALCPIWKKSNELFGKVFNYRPGTATLNADHIEAGLLYLGIKQGWASFNEWMQSPALKILKEVDEFLFCNLPRMERLAVAYKSFKLLKYYLNATKEELEKVPEWLRPSPSQARTKHPIALDFFAWPTLRDRLVQKHTEIFQTQELSRCYSHYLRFDWPFTFEDAFFFDEMVQAYYPSPLFERYHRDLKYWTVTDKFYELCPEMMSDIEGDRRRFSEVEVN
ncbi:uncharacterized protein BDR25DRAFT_376162 [Lindgomyces ingoldianus]|uniref:Uncharacterized protein n=1 Tax=Lindgomyces ingoldianus TaxID=673940 RepID=A0ACB6QM86_9PLEO|nr:uncharacterized protein BDR25DRAFT_376162 [Lindgomyces ingoldianus]KAF2467256.1 hypothetical protein BDR25DRAFT_376162 [Lindgomyces ingoldianus]